ncbi:hypothetical protein CERSUDRAFT_79741 [Gelatoporia subvermispora B]|uniref:Mid2 domain-containing protein n=1 Tax=Ceriporiopsis subvermispora (strain B) TaxID=914234 RepID=M2RT68_CERS8|nr:hypothetical protein CERSUDRAFT_79741 [Gelatoporia subvermispora B]
MQLRLGLLPSVLLLYLCSSVNAANFTFSYGAPTQCDPFPVSWSGGNPPFELTLIPIFGNPSTFQIPSSSYSNGQGSYSVQLPFAVNKTMLVTMSDASGFASGGTTNVLTVGPSVSNSNCNTTIPNVDFFFDTNSALAQCRIYTFSGYGGAVQPITIVGLIPAGDSFVLDAPTGPTSFDWTADIASGTSVVFIMTDSKGRSGGSSQVNMVGLSDETDCLTANVPSSVANPPSASTSHTSGTASTSSSTAPASASSGASSSSSSGTSGATIAGAVIGSLLGIAVVASLVIFLMRKRRSRPGQYYDDEGSGAAPAPVVHPYPFSQPGMQESAIDPATAYPVSSSADLLRSEAGSQYGPSSPMYPPSSRYDDPTMSGQGSHMQGGSVMSGTARGIAVDDAAPTTWRSQSMSSGARNKAAMAGISTYQPPARFILHTDAEDVVPLPEEDIIELPPQYSERRTPAAIPHALEDYSSQPPPLSPPPVAGPSSGILDDHDAYSGLQQPIQPHSPTFPPPDRLS